MSSKRDEEIICPKCNTKNFVAIDIYQTCNGCYDGKLHWDKAWNENEYSMIYIKSFVINNDLYGMIYYHKNNTTKFIKPSSWAKTFDGFVSSERFKKLLILM